MDASSNSNNNQGNGGSAGHTNNNPNAINKAENESTNTTKPLNSGAWTTEEFQYMLALMEAFKSGHLPLPEGTTLRSFLSSMLHCKPKRISKKFEGITYNGRLTYRKTKDPFSIQAAMLVRAQLSELERRYLLAAADKQRGPSQQDDGAATLDAMFIGGQQQQQQQQTNAAGGASVASLAWGSSLGVNHSSASPASFLGGGDLVGLGASFGAGLGAGLLEPTPLSPGLLLSPDNMRRLQNLPQAAQVGYGSDLFLSSSNPSTTASAGALLNQQQQQQLAANNALLSTQALMGDYQAQLRKVEQLQQQHQQRLAALSAANNAGASSGIGTTLPAVSGTTGNGGMNASISNATRQLLNQRSGWMSLGGGGSGGGGSSSAAPASTANSSAVSGFLPGLPTSTGGGSNTLPLSSSINAGSNSADPLNRFVLPAPVDDASFFRQRLLPHVAGPGVGGSGNNNAATASTTSMVGSMRLLDANFNNTTTTNGAAASSSVGGSGLTGGSNQDPSINLLLQNNGSGGGGALSNLLKRHREENDQLNLTQFGTATKRSR